MKRSDSGHSRITPDLPACEIRHPVSQEAEHLYRLLWEIFELDRPVYERLQDGTLSLSYWQWYTLFCGPEILGNPCIVPLKIWLAGRVVEILGIGGVATLVPYRGRGVARRLLAHCLDIIDREQKPSALYTTVPGMYAKFGFEVVDQAYQTLGIRPGDYEDPGNTVVVRKELDDFWLRELQTVYTRRYPNYDGKVLRDDASWPFYRLMINRCVKPRIFFCATGDQWTGYVRLDQESDRLMISEFCSDPEDAGQLGKIVYMRAQLSCWYPPIKGAWRQDPKKGGGGALIDMATHLYDLLEYFAGSVKTVTARTGRLVQKYKSEDASTTLLELKSGAHATVDCFFCIPDEASRTRLEIDGSKGAILAEGTIGQSVGGKLEGIFGLGAAGYDAAQDKDVVRTFQNIPFAPINPYTAECAYFADCILNTKAPTLNSGRNALAIIALTDKAYAAAKAKKILTP